MGGRTSKPAIDGVCLLLLAWNLLRITMNDDVKCETSMFWLFLNIEKAELMSNILNDDMCMVN